MFCDESEGATSDSHEEDGMVSSIFFFVLLKQNKVERHLCFYYICSFPKMQLFLEESFFFLTKKEERDLSHPSQVLSANNHPNY